jgi:hypothetical protein
MNPQNVLRLEQEIEAAIAQAFERLPEVIAHEHAARPRLYYLMAKAAVAVCEAADEYRTR